MFREGARAQRALAVALVLAVCAVVALATFRIAAQHSPALEIFRGGDDGGSPSAAGSPTPTGDSAKSPKKKKAKKGKRVAANGQQLWAPEPLARVRQDQGSSIPLPDGRTLWIFADTFQRHDASKPDEPDFFNTSAAAISEPGSWQLKYAADGEGVPTEFLPRTQAEFSGGVKGDNYLAVWPTGNVMLPDGRILIAYAKYRVHPRLTQFDFLGSGLFTYRYRSAESFLNGAEAQRIADDIWLGGDGAVRSPVYANGYVYFSQCENLQCYALRTRPATLSRRDSYQWWTGSDWSQNAFSRRNVSVYTNHPGGNASVVRLSNGIYAMADTEAGVVSQVGHLWVAPNPWGPWSAAASFFFPRCPMPGCYGLNLHPQQSTSTSLRVSYATGHKGPFVRLYDVPVSIAPDGSAIRVR
jgi:hypothetical protein